MLPEEEAQQQKSTAWADRTHTFLIWCLAFVRTKNKENCICRNLRLIINPDFLIPNQQREVKSRHLKGESILLCTERGDKVSVSNRRHLHLGFNKKEHPDMFTHPNIHGVYPRLLFKKKKKCSISEDLL